MTTIKHPRAGISTGNRCGHNPDKPDLKLRYPVAEKQPLFCKDVVKAVFGFFSSPRALKRLANSCGSRRQRRSESREAIAKTLSSLVKYLDLSTGKIGEWEGGKFENIPFEKLRHHAGLSKSRYKRAIRALKKVGYLGVIAKYEEKLDGTRRALVSIKYFTKALFKDLCVFKWFKDERERAKGRSVLRRNNQKLDDIVAAQNEVSTPAKSRYKTREMSPLQEENRRQELQRQAGMLAERYANIADNNFDTDLTAILE